MYLYEELRSADIEANIENTYIAPQYLQCPYSLMFKDEMFRYV